MNTNKIVARDAVGSHAAIEKISKAQAGVSLVEVLVTLIVMSVGMLGIAALYVTSLQAKTTSQSRMKAVNLAYDIADRIRANPTAANSYAIADIASAANPAAACIQTAATGVDCTPQQLAASDLFQWSALVRNAPTGLPGNVSGSITRTASTATTPEMFTILLGWSEQTGGNLTYSLQVQKCDPAVTPC